MIMREGRCFMNRFLDKYALVVLFAGACEVLTINFTIEKLIFITSLSFSYYTLDSKPPPCGCVISEESSILYTLSCSKDALKVNSTQLNAGACLYLAQSMNEMPPLQTFWEDGSHGIFLILCMSMFTRVRYLLRTDLRRCDPPKKNICFMTWRFTP